MLFIVAQAAGSTAFSFWPEVFRLLVTAAVGITSAVVAIIVMLRNERSQRRAGWEAMEQIVWHERFKLYLEIETHLLENLRIVERLAEIPQKAGIIAKPNSGAEKEYLERLYSATVQHGELLEEFRQSSFRLFACSTSKMLLGVGEFLGQIKLFTDVSKQVPHAAYLQLLKYVKPLEKELLEAPPFQQYFLLSELADELQARWLTAVRQMASILHIDAVDAAHVSRFRELKKSLDADLLAEYCSEIETTTRRLKNLPDQVESGSNPSNFTQPEINIVD